MLVAYGIPERLMTRQKMRLNLMIYHKIENAPSPKDLVPKLFVLDSQANRIPSLDQELRHWMTVPPIPGVEPGETLIGSCWKAFSISQAGRYKIGLEISRKLPEGGLQPIECHILNPDLFLTIEHDPTLSSPPKEHESLALGTRFFESVVIPPPALADYVIEDSDNDA